MAIQQKIIHMALEILQHSDEGKNLDPVHLTMVEFACNCALDQRRISSLYDLHRAVVINKDYKTTCFAEREHVTIDWSGRVYYKSQLIDQFLLDRFAHEDAKVLMKRIEQTCLQMEKDHITVNLKNYQDYIDG